MWEKDWGATASNSSTFVEGIDCVSGEVVVGSEGEDEAAEASGALLERTTVDGGVASERQFLTTSRSWT